MGMFEDMWNDGEDIGHGVRIAYFTVHQGAERGGIFVMHKHNANSDDEDIATKGFCMGSVNFDTPYMQEHFSQYARWQVISERPLTLSPSISQKSGPNKTECLHGFIQEGRWVPA